MEEEDCLITCIEMFPNFDPEIINIVVMEKASLAEMIDALIALNNELPNIDLSQIEQPTQEEEDDHDEEPYYYSSGEDLNDIPDDVFDDLNDIGDNKPSKRRRKKNKKMKNVSEVHEEPLLSRIYNYLSYKVRQNTKYKPIKSTDVELSKMD